MSQATNDRYHQDGRRRSQWSIDSLLDNEPPPGGPYIYNQQQPLGLDRSETAYDSLTTISTHYEQTPHQSTGYESQYNAGAKAPLSSHVKEVPRATSFANSSSATKSGFMRKVRHAWNYGWTAEIFSCTLAMISLISIIITLCLHDGKPLPKWPLGITINALIAILTVLMKAGLTIPLSEGIGQLKWQWFEERPRKLIDIDDYDTATRGPWGSFMFLFTGYDRGPSSSYQVPNDSWPPEKAASDQKKGGINWTGYLAKFAAFITVLTVAIDPFAQQIIAYVDCPAVSTSFQSRIARTNHYDTTGGHIGAGQTDIDGPMAVAINRGVVDPPDHIPSLVSTNCKSGNCTFPNFSTVGFCHACEDLTSDILNITSKTGPWNFTLPGDDNFDPLYLYYQYVFKTEAVIPIGNNILDFRMMGEFPGVNFSISAFHCSLAPCLRTYSAYMTDGTLEETLLSTTDIGQNQYLNGGVSFYRLVTSKTLRDGQEETCEPSDKQGPGLIEVAKTNIDAAPDSYPQDPPETTWYPEDCVWTFDLGSRYAILQELGQQLGDLDMQLTGGVAVGAVAAKNLWRNGTATLASTTSYFDKLAQVMTATIRNRGTGGEAEYAQGQVLVNETCVAVRWAWLSYPTVLAVLAAVFLGVIFMQSPREPSLRVWKSSALPLLFSSVDETKYDVNYYGMTKNHMNQFAEMVWVQLTRDEEGRAKFS